MEAVAPERERERERKLIKISNVYFDLTSFLRYLETINSLFRFSSTTTV